MVREKKPEATSRNFNRRRRSLTAIAIAATRNGIEVLKLVLRSTLLLLPLVAVFVLRRC